MIVLLSPAKTLDFESKPPLKRSTELLFPEKAAWLTGKLKKFSVRKLKSMMDISEDLAQLNVERYRNWTLPENSTEARQAIYAFKGDVYLGLEADKFSADDLRFAQDHLRILSGLYGVLRPCDRILPYRLEMGTSWKITPAKKNLYAYWTEPVTEQISSDLKASNSSIILNLASQEYAKAVDFKKLGTTVISPEFREERGGTFKMISFFAKKARGMMAAYVVKHQVSSAEALKNFDYEGYTFNERLSDTGKNKWVYTRKQTT